MRLTRAILSTLGTAIVVQTALSLVRGRAWWLRMHDFPRAQIAATGAAVGALLLWQRKAGERSTRWERLLPGALAVAVAVQTSRILPYTPVWKPEVARRPRRRTPADRRLRLVISNVCRKNRAFERWRSVVLAARPDVVVAVEADAEWDQQLEGLRREFPHSVRCPQPNTYGLLLFARWPLRGTKIKHLVEEDVPSLFTALELACGDPVRLVVLHPRPPRPDIAQDSVFRDAELVRAGRIIRRFRTPVVVVGDLNDVAWSHTTHLFQRIAHLQDPRVGRGLYPTYHADHPFLRYPLDHVFHSRHFDLIELRRLPHVGSDHFPILIELALRQDGTTRLDPERSDYAEEAAIDAVDDVRQRLQNETHREHQARQLADR